MDFMLRRGLGVLIALLAVALMVPLPVFAANTDIKVVLEGKELTFPDAKPFIDETGRVQVPLRFVAEALGLNVHWNQEAKSITLSRDTGGEYIGNYDVYMKVGQAGFDYLGASFEMDTAPTLKDGRVYVPLRFVAQAFDIGVAGPAAESPDPEKIY